MSAIKTIRTRNIQSHQDVLIELPETGVVVFTGDNSNGKSVMRKVLSDVISGRIKQLRNRKSLVRRAPGVHEGYLEITKYDGSKLTVCINLEASQTYVELVRAGGDTLKRYLSDKSFTDLVYEFGFHYNENRDISLNIFDSDDTLLFFRTSHATNGDVLDTALTDTDARMKYDVLNVQYNQAMQMRRTFEENARVAQTAKDAITIYDIEKETHYRDTLTKYATILSHIYIPELRVPPKVPMVLFTHIPPVRLWHGKFPLIVNIPPVRLRDGKKICEDLKELQKGVCPVCKRPFSVHQTSTSEM